MNGSLSGKVSKAHCQGSTFSLACHESEAGSGGCVRGCVRQQVQLGLPRQEVGRACVSYLIYGKAAGTLPVQMKKKGRSRRGRVEGSYLCTLNADLRGLRRCRVSPLAVCLQVFWR